MTNRRQPSTTSASLGRRPGHLKWRGFRQALCLAGLLFTLSPALLLHSAPAATAEEYVLGPQDKVRVKIYEWRASRDVIFEWSALNDVFTVGAAGTLSLPFAGEVKAAGLTPKEVAAAVGDGLMQNMGLGRRPDASIEVVEFRPFYILGDVMQPGEFPYRPGLTVLQALSIAGGLRTREEDLARVGREIIQNRGEINLLGLEKLNLLARKARLEAELAEAESIAFPDQLTRRQDQSMVAHVVQQEVLIFKARQETVKTQVSALENLRSYLEKELTSLEAQLGFLDKQVELIQKELTSVSSLVDKGLAAAPREMSLERALAQIQGERLSAETSLLRTRQEISRTEIAILELRNQQANDITVALRQTQADLDALARKAETAIDLLHESEISAPRLAASRARSAARVTYTIVRPTDNGAVTLPAEESTPVRPGDSVKVEIPAPAYPDAIDAGSVDLALPFERLPSPASADF